MGKRLRGRDGSAVSNVRREIFQGSQLDERKVKAHLCHKVIRSEECGSVAYSIGCCVTRRSPAAGKLPARVIKLSARRYVTVVCSDVIACDTFFFPPTAIVSFHIRGWSRVEEMAWQVQNNGDRVIALKKPPYAYKNRRILRLHVFGRK